jgi:hypothetical protein
VKSKLIFNFLIVGICFLSFNKRPRSASAVLSLPFGTYYNWTNYELRQINFRVIDDELLIDTTLNLKLEDFKIHFKERADSYPEIKEFLNKTSIEFVLLKERIDKLDKPNCGRQNTFWVQIEGTEKLDSILFHWPHKCNRKNIGRVNSVLEEMLKLKDKYK